MRYRLSWLNCQLSTALNINNHHHHWLSNKYDAVAGMVLEYFVDEIIEILADIIVFFFKIMHELLRNTSHIIF